MLYEEKQIETIPVGPLGLIPLKSCEDLGKKVDAWLVEWRKERESEHKTTIAFAGYQRDSYIIGAKTPRFGSGEAKGELTESVRGDDLYIMVDVCNYNMTYTMNGLKNHMSPDDHYQDLKRIISAATGKVKSFQFIPEDKLDHIDFERYHIVHDSRGIIWISTYGNGLFAYDPIEDKLEHFAAGITENSYINSDFLLFVMEDRAGGIWVSSEYSGVFIRKVRSCSTVLMLYV